MDLIKWNGKNLCRAGTKQTMLFDLLVLHKMSCIRALQCKFQVRFKYHGVALCFKELKFKEKVFIFRQLVGRV